MSNFENKLNQKAAELADLRGKSDEHVNAVGKYTVYFVLFFGAIFAASVYGIQHASTNAGQGVGWFAALLSGIALMSALWSWFGVLWEQYKRR
ncbi:MAG: hypothetical protein J0L82_02885 [Deltaproteobacteria bacterium]|jgi:hypothetical protein|nr:hypothetical protein [Deltaproteobacteria bacterium]